MMAIFDRITQDPNILAGKACIRGTRIPVSLVLNLLANGETHEDIIDDYPELDDDDILACLRYAEWVTSENVMVET